MSSVVMITKCRTKEMLKYKENDQDERAGCTRYLNICHLFRYCTWQRWWRTMFITIFVISWYCCMLPTYIFQFDTVDRSDFAADQGVQDPYLFWTIRGRWRQHHLPEDRGQMVRTVDLNNWQGHASSDVPGSFYRKVCFLRAILA